MYLAGFALAMLAPVSIFLVGLLWRLSPPPFQSGGLAYRTALSLKNQEIWDFAHRHCSRLWLRIGLISGVISAALMAVFKAHYTQFILWLLVAQMVFFCISAFLVDILLKNTFDEDGNRIG